MIERCRDAFPIRMMCRCLKVAPSGYYDWRGRPPSPRTLDNERLLGKIRIMHAESDGVLGAPRICDELRYTGESCGENRVARIMSLAGLKGIPQKSQWKSKRSGRRPDDVQNHLARDFKAVAPNTKWATDITFIRTAEGWLYLCIVLDLHSDIVVGWSMSHRQDRQLVLQARLLRSSQTGAREPSAVPIKVRSSSRCLRLHRAVP
jgi:putative transposase